MTLYNKFDKCFAAKYISHSTTSQAYEFVWLEGGKRGEGKEVKREVQSLVWLERREKWRVEVSLRDQTQIQEIHQHESKKTTLPSKNLLTNDKLSINPFNSRTLAKQ